jgi:trk system potassium uptake protein TrkH
LALEYGFYPDQLPRWLSTALPPVVQVAALLAFVAHHVHRTLVAPDRRAALFRYGIDTIVIVVALGLSAGFADSRGACLKAATVYVIVVQLFRESRLSLGMASTRLASSQRRLRPARLMVTSFLIVIVLGGLLLSLPRAMTPEHAYEEGFHLARRILNGFFTSTSATCVTGLAVYDTAGDFTRFGQAVILVLMQAGGLGIMMFGTLFGLLAGRRMSLADSLVLQDAMSHETIGLVSKMIRFIVIVTFSCEAIGAALLYSMWPASVDGVGERLFYSVFHAVSAFCNAGFALDAQSLVPYRGAWAVYGSIMPLIVLGGLGFPVLRDLARRGKARVRPGRADDGSEALGLPRGRASHAATRLTLHTRIALVMTAVLIVIPAIAFFVFESTDWRRRSQKPPRPPDPRTTAVMADMDWSDRGAAAVFLSVTARTAGFNAAAMDVNSLSTASHFLLCILMFVGGSPASTAGGVKTVAVAVLMLSLWDTLRRRPHVEVFGRTIPDDVVRRAGVVVVVMFLVVSITALMLCYSERGESTQEVLFESVSACCTVGLSTGLTPRLTVPGRVIIMAAMFAGRLGPLTLLIALAGRSRPAPYEYPEEQVIIG